MKLFKNLPPKSTEDKTCGGVVSGLAEFMGWSPGVTKVIVAALIIVTGIIPGLLVYAIAYLIMPKVAEFSPPNNVVTQADVDREAKLEGLNNDSK